ncbi:MAG: MarR family transcriptional regulator [Acidimicrobiia bacterium]|nr:MarR family transcriptional regulator [Acidimicrobiia bacterium]
MTSRELTQALAHEILRIVPLVMRTVAAELRAAGELPAPAHFGLLSVLAAQPHPLSLTDLAARQGVSPPTMSNSISALVARGWVRRSAGKDRRQVRIEVTAKGRATVSRVGRSAERHLAELLEPVGDEARQRLGEGLQVLLGVFGERPVRRPSSPRNPRVRRRASPTRPPEPVAGA